MRSVYIILHFEQRMQTEKKIKYTYIIIHITNILEFRHLEVIICFDRFLYMFWVLISMKFVYASGSQPVHREFATSAPRKN